MERIELPGGGPEAAGEGNQGGNAAQFLKDLRIMGPWTVTSINDGRLNSVTFAERGRGTMAKWIADRNGKVNLYWHINPTYGDPGNKASLEDVSHIERLHVDIDLNPTSGLPIEDQRAAILALLEDEARLKECGIPGVPSFIIDSGGGYWAFWDLVEPFSLNGPDQQARRDNAHRAGGYNKWIAETLNKAFGLHYADDCHNVDRIARLPYTLNIPSAKKRAAGRMPTLSAVIKESRGELYSLTDFGHSDVGEAGPCKEAVAAVTIEGDWTPLPTGDAWAAVQELVKRYPEVRPKTTELILLGKYLHDEGTDNLDDKSTDGKFVTNRSRVFDRVNLALQQAGVPLGLAIEILSDQRFVVSEHARFPANKDGKVSKQEVRGGQLRRFVTAQVKKAAARLRKREMDARIAAEALDSPLEASSNTPEALSSEPEASSSAPRAEAAPATSSGDGGGDLPPEPPEEPGEPPAPSGDGSGIFPPTMRINDIVREMNRRHAVLLQEGGKTRVLSWERTELDYSREVPVLQTFIDFTNRYSNQQVNVGTVAEPKMKSLGKFWLDHPARRQYYALRFQPGEPSVVDGYLNMWRGFAIQEQPGSWSLMQEHIHSVLASGNLEYADYIIKWAAWAVQNPDEPAEAALIFRGEQGTGKGTFARAMKRLFGQHGLQITSSSHLTGRFNQHLRDCCLLFADEAIAPGDKKAESVLKGLITEPELAIEGKGANLIQARNRLHVIMASNEKWVIPAGLSERRFAVFNVSGHKRGDTEYFSQLNAELENGGMEAMLYDLLSMELGDWHPRRNIPDTEALGQQKELSLGPVDQFLLHLLEEGALPGMPMPNSSNTVFSNDRKGEAGLYNCMRHSSPRLKELSDQRLASALKEWGCRRATNGAARGWAFPPLAEMRATWEEQYGRRVWEHPNLDWNIDTTPRRGHNNSVDLLELEQMDRAMASL